MAKIKVINKQIEKGKEKFSRSKKNKGRRGSTLALIYIESNLLRAVRLYSGGVTAICLFVATQFQVNSSLLFRLNPNNNFSFISDSKLTSLPTQGISKSFESFSGFLLNYIVQGKSLDLDNFSLHPRYYLRRGDLEQSLISFLSFASPFLFCSCPVPPRRILDSRANPEKYKV